MNVSVEPEAIKVFYSDREVANNTSVGPFDEGSQLSLTCDVSPGKPTPTLYWFKDEGKPIGKPQIDAKVLFFGRSGSYMYNDGGRRATRVTMRSSVFEAGRNVFDSKLVF